MPTATVAEIAVVGAGPAGAAAATCAARAGRSVVLIDKALPGRDKCCGDGLTTLALRRLDELGLRPDGLASWEDVVTVHLRAPGGRHSELRLPGVGHAAVVRRSELDAALVDLAVDAGATLRAGSAVTGVDIDPDPTGSAALTLADGGRVQADMVIAADGMWSPVRRMLGLAVPGYRGEWHAFRQYVHAEGPASRELWVWFDEDLLPGYAWSFPLADGIVNVGFGVLRDGPLDGGELKARWAGLMDRPHIREVLGATCPREPARAWPIPARIHAATLSAPRVLFVGDAAAACDPLTGEGIGQALETGMEAAAAIDAGGDPDAIADRYRRRTRAALSVDHRFGRLLGAVLSHPALAGAAIRAVDTSGWTRRNFARWMFEDYPRALAATPWRWRSGALSGPGAYTERA